MAGSHPSEVPLSKGYAAHGLVRRLTMPNLNHGAAIADPIHLHDGDLMDRSSQDAAVRASEADGVYNLRGDASKAMHLPNREPKVRFKELAKIMVEAELERVT